MSTENEQYKLIVIFGTALLLIFGSASIYYKVREYSPVVAFFVGPLLLFLSYKLMKAIWPNF
jgi:hypothetical protein